MIEVVKVEDVGIVKVYFEPCQQYRVTLENEHGKRFIVNIPEICWANKGEEREHGLNLVFGDGCHYD